MTRLLFKICLLGFFLCFPLAIQAQPPFSGQSSAGPIVSPYLGLANNGNGNADVSNYFTIVLPQIRAQQEFQRQQRQISQLQTQQRATPLAGTRGGSPIQTPQIRSTGHQSFFNAYSHYYTQPVRRQ
jgi:hypothetical protein